MSKLINIKVNTPKGERTLLYRPINQLTESNGSYICEQCPYYSICDKIPDPRDPEDAEKSFSVFCGDIERGNILSNNDNENSNDLERDAQAVQFECRPVEGTIENNLGDIFDICQELIKTNSLIRLQSVIESVCAGWCDSYDPSYCNCNSKNASCLLCNLFKSENVNLTSKKDEDSENGSTN